MSLFRFVFLYQFYQEITDTVNCLYETLPEQYFSRHPSYTIVFKMKYIYHVASVVQTRDNSNVIMNIKWKINSFLRINVVFFNWLEITAAIHE